MKLLLSLLLLSPIWQIHYAATGKPAYFIAMEYKGLSNCIYKVYVADSLIFGAKVNGYITVQPSYGMGKFVPKEKMHDPDAYVDEKNGYL